jgi:hypothetical protein
MLKIPCTECPVYISCKIRFHESISMGSIPSVCQLAFNEGCFVLRQFTEKANQNDINRLRLLFSLKAIE